MNGTWYHRGPCCRCTICGGDGCYVWHEDDGETGPGIHICAAGCDVPAVTCGDNA